MLTLSVGGAPLLTVECPSGGVHDFVARELAHLVTDGVAPLALACEHEVRPDSGAEVHLEGLTFVRSGEQLFLLDPSGRGAQLPVHGEERRLAIDPHFDSTVWGALHVYLYRMLEWRLAAAGMASIKGSALAFEHGGIAVAGFPGAGKSSLHVAMVPDATGYLGEERVVFCGPAELAAFPTVIQLALGRHYDRGPATDGLSRVDRLRLRLGGAIVDGSGGGAVGAYLRRKLELRWVAVDVADFAPHLAIPERAPLRDLVFLQPELGGPARLERISTEEGVRRAAVNLGYVHRSKTGPFDTAFGYLFPDLGEWPGSALAPQLEQLPSLVGDARCWVLSFPRRTDRGRLAHRLLEELRTADQPERGSGSSGGPSGASGSASAGRSPAPRGLRSA